MANDADHADQREGPGTRHRALQAQLAAAGTGFAELLDNARRTHTLSLLANRSLPLTDVASRSGFGTPEGLSRALRRWTGLTPTAWRQSQPASR